MLGIFKENLQIYRAKVTAKDIHTTENLIMIKKNILLLIFLTVELFAAEIFFANQLWNKSLVISDKECFKLSEREFLPFERYSIKFNTELKINDLRQKRTELFDHISPVELNRASEYTLLDIIKNKKLCDLNIARLLLKNVYENKAKLFLGLLKTQKESLFNNVISLLSFENTIEVKELGQESIITKEQFEIFQKNYKNILVKMEKILKNNLGQKVESRELMIIEKKLDFKYSVNDILIILENINFDNLIQIIKFMLKKSLKNCLLQLIFKNSFISDDVLLKILLSDELKGYQWECINQLIRENKIIIILQQLISIDFDVFLSILLRISKNDLFDEDMFNTIFKIFENLEDNIKIRYLNEILFLCKCDDRILEVACRRLKNEVVKKLEFEEEKFNFLTEYDDRSIDKYLDSLNFLYNEEHHIVSIDKDSIEYFIHIFETLPHSVKIKIYHYILNKNIVKLFIFLDYLCFKDIYSRKINNNFFHTKVCSILKKVANQTLENLLSIRLFQKYICEYSETLIDVINNSDNLKILTKIYFICNSKYRFYTTEMYILFLKFASLFFENNDDVYGQNQHSGFLCYFFIQFLIRCYAKIELAENINLIDKKNIFLSLRDFFYNYFYNEEPQFQCMIWKKEICSGFIFYKVYKIMKNVIRENDKFIFDNLFDNSIHYNIYEAYDFFDNFGRECIKDKNYNLLLECISYCHNNQDLVFRKNTTEENICHERIIAIVFDENNLQLDNEAIYLVLNYLFENKQYDSWYNLLRMVFVKSNDHKISIESVIEKMTDITKNYLHFIISIIPSNEEDAEKKIFNHKNLNSYQINASDISKEDKEKLYRLFLLNKSILSMTTYRRISNNKIFFKVNDYYSAKLKKIIDYGDERVDEIDFIVDYFVKSHNENLKCFFEVLLYYFTIQTKNDYILNKLKKIKHQENLSDSDHRLLLWIYNSLSETRFKGSFWNKKIIKKYDCENYWDLLYDKNMKKCYAKEKEIITLIEDIAEKKEIESLQKEIKNIKNKVIIDRKENFLSYKVFVCVIVALVNFYILYQQIKNISDRVMKVFKKYMYQDNFDF